VEVGVVTADPQGFPDHWFAGMFRCRYEVMMRVATGETRKLVDRGICPRRKLKERIKILCLLKGRLTDRLAD
jgi:hypothetical protein